MQKKKHTSFRYEIWTMNRRRDYIKREVLFGLAVLFIIGGLYMAGEMYNRSHFTQLTELKAQNQ